MDFSELLKSGATPTDIQKYLMAGETVAVTFHVLKNLRDFAKEVFAMRRTNFSALVREATVNGLRQA